MLELQTYGQDMCRIMAMLVKCTLDILQVSTACQQHTYWWQSKMRNVFYSLVLGVRVRRSF